MKTKNCIICGVLKSLDEYYIHPKMADGHLNKCKDCTKDHVKKRTDALRLNGVWLEKEKQRSREKYHRLGYRSKFKPSQEAKKLAISKYIEKYPEKYRATKKITNSKIKIEPGMQQHHWSYNEEHHLDTIKLSIEEHRLAHRHMVYDQERMMYRRIDTMELLDTKEQHEQYIKNLPF